MQDHEVRGHQGRPRAPADVGHMALNEGLGSDLAFKGVCYGLLHCTACVA